ncbi:hypothetical protein ABIE44_003455 [Marmoricola sp. OAE513]|uniref:DUF3043 domain-containing protein n=1 Tax=Marmoricola sp. OAE513 TaxID=2817894 RepID=UPI001AEB4E32
MFGRSDSSSVPESQPVESAAADKKGRPTPTRKEAEAAAKARAQAAGDKKAAAKLLRETRGDSNKRIREGMKNGEEKYLPARDKGPVKRAVRDWVDSRLMFTEFILPILLVILVAGSVGNKDVQNAAGILQTVTMVLLVVDVVTIRFRLKKALTEQFPGESLKGTTFYGFTRVLQLRFMRLPKPQVRIGGKPI